MALVLKTRTSTEVVSSNLTVPDYYNICPFVSIKKKRKKKRQRNIFMGYILNIYVK